MLVKEFIVARRWLALCALIVAVTAFFDTLNTLNTLVSLQSGADVQGVVIQTTPEPYTRWFTGTGAVVLTLITALLGGELIAGEVSKGTIGFLLSRPISRDRILLTKYLSGGVTLLALTLLGSAVHFALFSLTGYPPPIVDTLVGPLLLWCSMLSVLGIALIWSVLFKDPIGPALLTVETVFLYSFIDVGVCGLTTGHLCTYALSYSAYLSGEPMAALFVIWLTSIGLLLGTALVLFRRRAY